MAARKKAKRETRGVKINVKTAAKSFTSESAQNVADNEINDKSKLEGMAAKSIVIKKRKNASRGMKKDKKQGVVYLSHIPHGFYEPQMKEYFAQFGKVRRLVLRRSNKTGKSRGYAFIQFEDDAVAKIVAETMNNYLMFERVLKCKFIPHGGLIKKRLFYNVNIDHIKRAALEKKRAYNAPKSKAKVARLVTRKAKKANKLAEQLAQQGISFSFDVPTNSSATVLPKRTSNLPQQLSSPTFSNNSSSVLPEPSVVLTVADTSAGDGILKTPDKPKRNKRRKKNKLLQKTSSVSSDINPTGTATSEEVSSKSNGKQKQKRIRKHRKKKKQETQA